MRLSMSRKTEATLFRSAITLTVVVEGGGGGGIELERMRHAGGGWKVTLTCHHVWLFVHAKEEKQLQKI